MGIFLRPQTEHFKTVSIRSCQLRSLILFFKSRCRTKKEQWWINLRWTRINTIFVLIQLLGITVLNKRANSAAVIFYGWSGESGQTAYHHIAEDWTQEILCPIQPCLLDLVVCYVLPFLWLKTSHPVPLYRHLSTCQYGLWGQAPGLLWSQITLPSGHLDSGSEPTTKTSRWKKTTLLT